MNKLSLRAAAVAALLVLSSCGKPGNPLLAASDGQFQRWIEPRSPISPSCAAALYEPALFVRQYNGIKFAASSKISAVSDQQKNGCIAELQQRASAIGIQGNVTRDHLFDDRVRQRYYAMKKG